MRCSGMFRAIPVFQGLPVFCGVPGCSEVFRCSGVPVFRCSGVFRGVPGCSRVPGFSTCGLTAVEYLGNLCLGGSLGTR